MKTNLSVPDEQTKTIGQIYKFVKYEENVRSYILAQVDEDMINLISLDNGNRWGDSTKVVNPYYISKSEWEELIGKNYLKYFILERESNFK